MDRVIAACELGRNNQPEAALSLLTGLDVYLLCAVCGTKLHEVMAPPVTGRCGHIICHECHKNCVIAGTIRDQFTPCPSTDCLYTHAFERKVPPACSQMDEFLSKRREQTKIVVDTLMHMQRELTNAKEGLVDSSIELQCALDERSGKDKILQDVTAKLQGLSQLLGLTNEAELGRKDQEIESLKRTIKELQLKEKRIIKRVRTEAVQEAQQRLKSMFPDPSQSQS